MSQQVKDIATSISKESVSMFRELENIRLTIINIRIAVAKLTNNPEARGLDVVADHISQALFGLEGNAKVIEKEANSILGLLG